MSNSVLIIHPEGNIANNPSMKAIIDLLKELGLHVIVNCRNRSDVKRDALTDLSWVVDNRLIWWAKAFIFNRVSSKFLASVVSVLSHFYYKKRNIGFVIGVDRQGVIEASGLAARLHVSFCYISFEIFFKDETSVRFKELERHASQRAKFIIVQDKTRSSCLCTENGVRENKIILLPLASRGLERPSSYRLRDRLGIPPSKKVAISIGSLDSWTMTPEVLSSLEYWPSEWVLIVHHRYGNTEAELDKISSNWKKYLGERLYISNMPSDLVDGMSETLAGVNLGLAFYKSIPGNKYLGKNIEYIGFSSGKIATCLRNGVPILTNETGSMCGFISANRVGLVIESPGQIPIALEKVSLLASTAEIKEVFLRSLDFDVYRERLRLAFSDMFRN